MLEQRRGWGWRRLRIIARVFVLGNLLDEDIPFNLQLGDNGGPTLCILGESPLEFGLNKGTMQLEEEAYNDGLFNAKGGWADSQTKTSCQGPLTQVF